MSDMGIIAASEGGTITGEVTAEVKPKWAEVMQAELTEVKSRVDGLGVGVKIGNELRMLTSLIPDADLRIIDEEGYSALERGDGLVMAYIMSERRQRMAREAEERRKVASIGDIGDVTDGLYTIEEIKKMDRKAVRKNFDRIMRSLEKR